MRLYGKRILRKAIRDEANYHVESRDALVWEIDLVHRYCRVKVQGSDEEIVSYFPMHWGVIPRWLRVGNAVRIQHTQGVRGRIEIIGHGIVMPVPLSGTTKPPDSYTTADSVLTGMLITVTSGTDMRISISPGTFRIDNITYTFSAFGIIMELGSTYIMGDGGFMGASAAFIGELDPAPAAGYYRYDCFVIAADKVVDYLKGTAVVSNPIKPAIPPDHILIDDYILVYGGMTVVSYKDIGRVWDWPHFGLIEFTAGKSNFDWEVATRYPIAPYDKDMTTPIVTRVLDQYNNLYSLSSVPGSWSLTWTLMPNLQVGYTEYGSWVLFGQTKYSNQPVTKDNPTTVNTFILSRPHQYIDVGSPGNSADDLYRGYSSDCSPLLEVYLTDRVAGNSYRTYIQLYFLDSSGQPMKTMPS